MVAFAEVQHYNYAFVIALGCVLVFGLPFFWRYAEKKMYFYFFGIPFSILFIYFMLLRIEVRIDNAGIYYRRFPTSFSFDTVLWSDVSRCEMYKLQFHYYVAQRPKYSVGGEYALRIITNQGNILILGTALPNEMRRMVPQLAPPGKWSAETVYESYVLPWQN
jgi:hypothetical protein